MTIPYPVRLADGTGVRLKRVLQEAGFAFDAVKARLGTQYCQWAPAGAGVVGKLLALLQAARMRVDIGNRMLSPASSGILGGIADYFRHKAPKDTLDLLIRLFLFNEPVEATTLLGVFSANDLDALAAMNLIRLDAGVVVSDLALFECAGLLLATDAKVRPPAGVNRVMPLLPESFDFVGSVSRRPVDSALDLCTGSGVHALVMARHAQHVVATDINPRALRFAQFNAWLNGVANIEFAQGDLFGALEGRAFDLILANPPYMPVTGSSPGDNSYCGGKSGDVLWSQIVRGLEKHLRLGGLCQMIHMIVLFGSETYEDKIRALLGPLSNSCSLVVSSSPIAFRNRHITAASSVHFGVTSIKRYPQPGGVFYAHVPFHPPLPFDVSDLFLALEQTSRPEERALVCKRHYGRSRRNN